MNPRPYADVIKAWADGADVQVWLEKTSVWIDSHAPDFNPGSVWRVKPKETTFFLPIEEIGTYLVHHGGYSSKADALAVVSKNKSTLRGMLVVTIGDKISVDVLEGGMV